LTDDRTTDSPTDADDGYPLFNVIYRMDPTVKAYWLTALRSGEYPQTSGKLHRAATVGVNVDPEPEGFCCLGVLCRLAELRGVNVRVVRQFDVFLYGAEPSDNYLPEEVRHWAGLNRINPIVPVTAELVAADPRVERLFVVDESDSRFVGYVSLDALNDAGVSFDVIANLIEEYL
jgi:hypothetical protein